MIFPDLMNHADFSQAMERRIYEDTTVHVDIIGMKQERANACGEASRNMILSYHGIDYGPATDADFSPRVIDRLGYSVLLSHPQQETAGFIRPSVLPTCMDSNALCALAGPPAVPNLLRGGPSAAR